MGRVAHVVFSTAFFLSSIEVLADTGQVCEQSLRSRQTQDRAFERLRESGFLIGGTSADGRLFVEETFAAAEALIDSSTDSDVGCSFASNRLGFSFKKYCSHKLSVFKTFAAQKVYRPTLNLFRWTMSHGGDLFRKYLSGQDMDTHALRWNAVEKLFHEGQGTGSFGHPVRPGMVEVMSPVVQAIAKIDRVRQQLKSIGHPLRLASGEMVVPKPLQIGAMVSVSGMSFPQLSAQSHISLIYMHLKLQKDGISMLLNTGEGGPRFHLAILRGDTVGLREEVVQWAVETGRFEDESWSQARVEIFIEELMKIRNELFAEFSDRDLHRAQIVAQFGSALNGIRNSEGRIDFRKLKKIAAEPGVAMIQFKLKQAAKRGAKVNASKVDEVTAAMRELQNEKIAILHSPKISAELSSWDDIAAVVVATKILTGKPVSLKMGVGDLDDAYEFLRFLRDSNALPDHLQIDGRGAEFSPGSGNAPFLRNTSLPLNEALLATNAFLRKLGVRDQIYLEATGDVLLHSEGVEKLALGADGISAARLWMGMGLGCAQVRQCASGTCPYGIASASKAFLSHALDPRVIGPKGYQAATAWHSAYVATLGESGVEDWRNYFSERGIGNPKSQLRKVDAKGLQRLETYYDMARLRDLFGTTLSDEEIKRFVYSSAN